MIAMAYAVPTGVIAGWTGVLDMILTPAKVSQVGLDPLRVHLDTPASSTHFGLFATSLYHNIHGR